MNWQKIRQEVLLRDNYKCQQYSEDSKRLEIHHRIPRKRGGIDILENLITLCIKCHRKSEPREKSNIKYTLIKVHIETHAELNRIGLRGESFDAIIRKCIEAYKKAHKL
jgi:5-methylcytosine-specific restriction endonuclease McrA